MSTAHEPSPYGHAGEGTVPDDDLEDTAESITLPVDDMTGPPEATELEDDQ